MPTATKVNFSPGGDRVLIEPAEQAQMSSGGVYIPDTAKEKPQEGTILAVGPGRKTDKGDVIKIDYKVGDRVFYSKYTGSEIKIDGKEYLVCKESDILGTINR